MRRRNMHHEENSKPAPVTAISEAFQKAEEKKRGQCPKCGKIIGRGVHFHAKACKA